MAPSRPTGSVASTGQQRSVAVGAMVGDTVRLMALKFVAPWHNTLQVKRSATRCLTGVSGQRPEQGAAAKFFAQHKTWAQGPYPAQ